MLTTTKINFFRNRSQKAQQQGSLDKKILEISVGVLGVAVVFTGASFGWLRWNISLEQKALNQQQTQNRVITQSSGDEQQYVSFVSRLDNLQGLLENRNSKKEALDFLAVLARPSIGFDGIVYDARSKLLSFRVQAESVFAVETFLDEIRQPTTSIFYQDVQVSNIRRDDEGKYIMELAVLLKGALENGR